MSLFVGSTEFSGAYVGSSAVDAIYLGDTKVWPLIPQLTISGVSTFETGWTGVALRGSRNRSGNSSFVDPSSDRGTIVDPGGWMIAGPSSGVTNWTTNILAANGDVYFHLRDNDNTTSPTSASWSTQTVDSLAWPLGDVVFSENKDGTGNPYTITPAMWNLQSSSNVKSAGWTSQVGWRLLQYNAFYGATIRAMRDHYLSASAPSTFYVTIYPA